MANKTRNRGELMLFSSLALFRITCCFWLFFIGLLLVDGTEH